MIKSGSKPRSPEEHFWQKVDVGEPDECWEWRAGKSEGYGRFWAGGKLWHFAHRFSWTLAHGEIPMGMCILHRCDNRPCVNPNHLFLGTRADNNADMGKKGRSARGSHHWNAKLSEKQVRKIRKLYATGNYTQKALGKTFGMSKQQIGRVVRQEDWNWIKGKESK